MSMSKRSNRCPFADGRTVCAESLLESALASFASIDALVRCMCANSSLWPRSSKPSNTARQMLHVKSINVTSFERDLRFVCKLVEIICYHTCNSDHRVGGNAPDSHNEHIKLSSDDFVGGIAVE